MSNFDTVQAITTNLEKVLRGLGLKFSPTIFDDAKNIPASLIPLGEIFYNRETFEYTHGQKPEYAEAEYALRVTLSYRNPADMMREQQRWVHLIRDGLTVNALNIGDLVTSKLVSRVTTEEAAVENDRSNGIAAISYRTLIRYREV
ncbi:hypothetical protein PLCT1_02345 [Planctomycetaceae bacterium]|nr:hypothetical protein PLCT1_02345 [Planctomycetaceae bacterium]